MAMTGFFSRKRIIFLSINAIILVSVIVFQYGKNMLVPETVQVQPKITIERGSILDRNGKILAVQTTLYNIAITRSAIQDKPLFSSLVGPVCGLPEEELLALLNASGSDFFYLKKKISESEKNALAETVSNGRLRGIRLEPVQSRTYPENSLAAHVVGFLGDDGRGLTGVEYSFQDILSPPVTTKPGHHAGYNVMLTIDGTLQYELEQVSRTVMEETRAEAVIMVVAKAKTGEILAYISEPSANLNTFPESTRSERLDRPALYAYEPGSVFKIFTVASSLDMGLVQDNELFFCDGGYTFTTGRGETISIKCLDRHGWITPRDVIRLSCNDGAAQIAERAADTSFEDKLRAFGFGTRTGIELPGETNGLFAPASYWSLRSKPTIAIGQEISVSALQMVEAATVLANKGTRLKLTLLSRLYTSDGLVAFEHRPQELGTVVSTETAELLLDYMHTTSETGTGTRASVGDVPMAVKTGTAQMLDRETGGYSTTDFISSCMGIFPADDPEIIIYLAIVKPVGETYGGRIAAPVISTASNIIIDQMGFGRAQATSVRHSGIIPLPPNHPVTIGQVIPDLTGVSKRMLMGLLERTDLAVVIHGDGYVVDQKPLPGTPVEEGMTLELWLE